MQQDAVVESTIAGAQAEGRGMDSDTKGEWDDAIAHYKESSDLFQNVINLINSSYPQHSRDLPALQQHNIEIQSRITYLMERKERGDTSDPIPINQHISAVQLSMQVAPPEQPPMPDWDGTAQHETVSNGSAKDALDNKSVMLGAAGVGAVAGYATLGIFLGPIALLGGAAAGAYASQRQDTTAGKVANTVGTATASTVRRASQLNEAHDITGKLKRGTGSILQSAKEVDERHSISEKATELGSNIVTGIKNVDEKYNVSEKVAETTKSAIEKAKELNEKHRISEKAAAGVSQGLTKLNSLFSRSRNN